MYVRSTRQAQLLKQELEKRNLMVRDEVNDGYKHIDLVISRAYLNIEVDGKQHYETAHQILSDLDRNHYSDDKGWATVHIPNAFIDNPQDLQKVADALAKTAYVRIRKFGHRLPYHHYT